MEDGSPSPPLPPPPPPLQYFYAPASMKTFAKEDQKSVGGEWCAFCAYTRMAGVNKWLLIFAAVGIALASAFPAVEDAPEDPSVAVEDGLQRAYRFIQSCGEKDMAYCFKMKALTFVDRALRKPGVVELVDGVSLVHTQDGQDVSRELNGRALSEAELDASLPKNADERDAQVETLLIDRVAKFLQSHTLQLKVPDSAITEVKKTLDEGKYFDFEGITVSSRITMIEKYYLLEYSKFVLFQ
ncbi:hypothetical protein C0J52_17063 [Blattella germanica]|nr:hypothetical protein C0J52_17063 [Blattella germanica]